MGIEALKKLPNVAGVGASQTFTVSIPVGAKEIEKIGLDYSGTTVAKADITNLELKVDAQPIQQFKTISHLEMMSAYYGMAVNGGEIVLPQFAEWMNSAAQAAKFNLGLSDVSVMQLTGDIGAAAVAPAIAAWSVETQAPAANGLSVEQANRLGVFRRVRNFSYQLSGAGTTEIDNIPREDILMALHLIQSANVITNVEVWANDSKVWDASAARAERVVERMGRTAQAGCYHVDFSLQNELGTQLVLSGLNDFRLKVTHSGSATLVLYSETMSSYKGG